MRLFPVDEPAMDDLYRLYDLPSDQIANDEEHRNRFARLFNSLTGNHFSGDEIATLLRRRRKAGHLPRIREVAR